MRPVSRITKEGIGLGGYERNGPGDAATTEGLALPVIRIQAATHATFGKIAWELMVWSPDGPDV